MLSVSVIIPTYNRQRLIVRAIESALQQCRPGDEILVIDDGSTDDTAAVVAQFGGAVKYHRVPNGGAGKARNIGIQLAQCDLVAFLDSDDQWFPHKLELQRGLMERREDVLFCFSDFAVTDAEGRATHNYLPQWLDDIPHWEETIKHGRHFSSLTPLPSGCADFTVHVADMSTTFLLNLAVLTSSLMVRRREAAEALAFADDLAIYEDWFCFAALSLKGLGAFLNCETTWQHGHAQDRLSDANKVDRASAWLAIDQRLWSRDATFQAHCGEVYAAALDERRRALVRALLAQGRTREARGALQNVVRAPWSYRLLAHTPAGLVSWAAATARRLALV